ncbi:MAG: hypothetical protein H7338_24195 [Candidatus Sericytochromatia bacterium]|nr:hypothetical protein [Candidatus Sericytochromatia bacterium]
MNIQLHAMRQQRGSDAYDTEWTKTVTVGAVPVVGSYLVVEDGNAESVFEVTRVVFFGVVGKGVPAIVAEVEGFFEDEDSDGSGDDINAR